MRAHLNSKMRRRRQSAETRGRRAEMWAALWLRLKGYRILAQRVRTPLGEIDLIARRGDTLIFVEVKYRPDRLQAAQALSPQALARVKRAANFLLGRYAHGCGVIRIDAIMLCPGRLPCHVEHWCEGEWR